MKYFKAIFLLLLIGYIPRITSGQNPIDPDKLEEAMLKATRFMVEEVSYNGGYVWSYLPDFSRRWGEMEAFPTMIWLQNPGTISMGDVFLDAYRATGNEYYYEAAEKAAAAIIWGQSTEGGWNYMIDFAGDRSLRHWYATIGKNAWRLEEFQHYYGNCTFDDDVTFDAARFLLRIYLEKLDPKYRPALDKAIGFILESQYPIGGWPQRYPLKYEFSKNGRPDYTSYCTFNDNVIVDNVNFLILCYLTLGKQEYLDPIRRGMDYYLVSQHASGGWAQQYDQNQEPAGARSYEPRALLPGTTFENAMHLMNFYELTGDQKYLVRVPHAIAWLEKTRLPASNTQEGRYTHAVFLEPGTNKPIYVHRKGSNVIHGYYYTDSNDDKPLRHYGPKTRIPLDLLQERYDSLASLDPAVVVMDSPLNPSAYTGKGTPQENYSRWTRRSFRRGNESRVEEILASLDEQGRWLSMRAMTSHPYVGDGTATEETDQYASTMVGDETDTSPYWDGSGQEYISTRLYITNMQALITALE